MNNEGTVALNNFLQARNQLHLLSWEERNAGPPHLTQWTVTCKFGGEVLGVGTGAQKHIARDAAAAVALKALRENSAS
ncbi:hypothetical protein C8Q75DRAFT_444164 [Abortiporus biennis]|nr:hypothetical protein C8Q75DRAFT_444164 [Abortiporus biennis]